MNVKYQVISGTRILTSDVLEVAQATAHKNAPADIFKITVTEDVNKEGEVVRTHSKSELIEHVPAN